LLGFFCIVGCSYSFIVTLHSETIFPANHFTGTELDVKLYLYVIPYLHYTSL